MKSAGVLLLLTFTVLCSGRPKRDPLTPAQMKEFMHDSSIFKADASLFEDVMKLYGKMYDKGEGLTLPSVLEQDGQNPKELFAELGALLLFYNEHTYKGLQEYVAPEFQEDLEDLGKKLEYYGDNPESFFKNVNDWIDFIAAIQDLKLKKDLLSKWDRRRSFRRRS